MSKQKKEYKGVRLYKKDWLTLSAIMEYTHLSYIYLISEAIQGLYKKYMRKNNNEK